MYSKKLAAAALTLAAIGLTPAQAAPAGPALAPNAVKSSTESPVTNVQYRRWHGHRGYYRGGRGWGRGVAIGLGAAVVGGIIANEIYRPRAGYYYDDYAYDGPYYRPSRFAGDARTLCAENFRSFEWRTGLYTTYDGDKRLCPYLR
jgi:hypothetical protein